MTNEHHAIHAKVGVWELARQLGNVSQARLETLGQHHFDPLYSPEGRCDPVEPLASDLKKKIETFAPSTSGNRPPANVAEGPWAQK